MYPLRILTIGCTENVLPELRHIFTNLSVEIEGEFVDATSCLAYISANPATDRLMILQPKSGSEVAHMERLNDSAVGQPILALVDAADDPSLLMRAMRAGAAQIVRLPLETDDLWAAMLRIAIQFGHPASPSRAIAVLGATEGSGATMISINLASEIGRLRNAPCILAESAVSFGRLAHYLNIAPQVTIGDLLKNIDQIDVERFRRALTKVEDNLQVLAGCYRTISPQELSIDAAFKLLGFAKQLADVVVVDGRYVCEGFDFNFLDRIQHLVLVSKPTVPALANLRVLLDSLTQRECMAQQIVVINQFVSGNREFSEQRIVEILNVPKVFTVAADYASIRSAENVGQTLRVAAPRSRTLADITKLAQAVLGIATKPPHAFASLWDSLSSVGHALHLN